MDAYIGTTPSWVHDKEKKYKDIIDKAYKDALYDFYKHAFKAQIVCDFMQEGTIPYVPSNQVQKQLLDKAIANACTKPPYCFLTINPKPGITLSELQKKVEKFVKRKFIHAHKYVYEIRKENDQGLHCHMLVHYTCKPYDLKRGAKSTFNAICNVNDPHILNFVFIKNEDINQKVEYMKGMKQDKKLPGVKLTQLYRKKHKLLDIYESESPLESQIPLLGDEETNDLILD